MPTVVDLVDFSEDPVVKPYLTGDDDSFVRQSDGNYLAIRRDAYNRNCSPRLIERGHVVMVDAESGEDLAREGYFLGIVLSTDVIEGDHIRILWLYTTKYTKALTESSTTRVSNKNALRKSVRELGLYPDGVFLSDLENEIPVSSISGVLSKGEFNHKYTFDRRVTMSHLPDKEFVLVQAGGRTGTPEI